MARQLAVFLWFVSSLSWASQSEPISMLSQEDLQNSDSVVHWLEKNGATTDQTEAKAFYSEGLKSKESQRWSPAAKMFGESALRYPSPQTISEYTYVMMKMLGQVRNREKAPLDARLRDMASAISLYESAIAANSLTQSLSGQDQKRITDYIICLKEFVATSRPSNDCPPAYYFSNNGNQ